MGQAKNTIMLPADEPGALDQAVAMLQAGGLVAFPTDTVYGLGVDAFQPRAVERIFEVKGRLSQKAIPLLLANTSAMETVVQDIPPTAWRLAERFWPGGLTLVLHRRPIVPDIVTAGGSTVAVRVPNHPVALRLIQLLGRPLAATSANHSGQPSPQLAQEVVASLGGLIDIVLDGGPVPGGIDSTVLDLSSPEAIVRRAGAISMEELQQTIGADVRMG